MIPWGGSVSGTLRMMDAQLRQDVGPPLEAIVQSVVRPYGVSATIEHLRGPPPVVNDAELVASLRRAPMLMLGAEAPTPTAQFLGGEDFAWYLQGLPGPWRGLVRGPREGVTHDLQQGDLVVDERTVAIGAGLRLGADGPSSRLRPSRLRRDIRAAPIVTDNVAGMAR